MPEDLQPRILRYNFQVPDGCVRVASFQGLSQRRVFGSGSGAGSHPVGSGTHCIYIRFVFRRHGHDLLHVADMAAIRPCTGTTADWKAVEDTLILKEREVGVEIDTSGHYLVRQGDGKNKFFDLPIIVNNARYEEILELTQGYMNTVNNFSKNMTEATNSANSAAKTASDAAASATAGAKACEGIVDGLNTMVDTVTKKTCVLSIEDGILTIREA